MQVILLERVEKLGQMGEVVNVKNGYARNFLLPQKKALRATSINKERFEKERAQLEVRNLERRKEAASIGEKLEGQSFIILRQASESGQLYGSVNTRDIAEIITQGGFSIARSQINLDHPIKTISLHSTRLILHPEVSVNVEINVARTAEEAERQARGEQVTEVRDEVEDQEVINAEEVFETAELALAASEELAESELNDESVTEEAAEKNKPETAS